MMKQRLLPILSLAVATAMPLAPHVSAHAPTPAQQAPRDIAACSVTPVDALRPGEVLAFRIDGPPQARVSVQIRGATAVLQMTETKLGHYEGEYVNRLENNMNKKVVYRVSLRMDNGTVRSFDDAEDPGLRTGTRVKVDSNALSRA